MRVIMLADGRQGRAQAMMALQLDIAASHITASHEHSPPQLPKQVQKQVLGNRSIMGDYALT